MLGQVKKQLHATGKGDQIPSVALWATVGMGKTQIALEYAYREREDGLQAVLWIDAENESEYLDAFNQVANAMELPGAADPKGHEQNRLLVIRWLQETSEFCSRSSPHNLGTTSRTQRNLIHILCRRNTMAHGARQCRKP